MSSKVLDFFPPRGPATGGEKSRRNPAASLEAFRPGGGISEPLTSWAVVIHHAGAAVVLHATLHPAVPPAPAAKPAASMGQDGEPPLLVLIQRLVEWIRGIGDLLHGGRHRRHGVGAFAQVRHRVLGLLLSFRLAPGLRPRFTAFDPQLDEIA